MDKETTAVKAARALAAMLDALYRMVAALVLGLLGLVGIRPKATGGGLARAVAAEASGIVAEPRSELGEAVIERALQLRGMSSSPLPVPLPAAVEEWLATLSAADLKTVTGIPPLTLEQHVTSGEAGCLGALGYVMAKPPAPARIPPAVSTAGGKGKAGLAVDLGLDADLDDLMARFVPAPGMRFR